MEKDSRIQRKGFNKALITAFSRDKEHVIEDDVEYLKKFLWPVPDAWLINEEERTVIWYEVEDTHHLSDKKVCALYHIAFALDYCSWTMGVIVYDRYGKGGPLDIFKPGVRLAYR